MRSNVLLLITKNIKTFQKMILLILRMNIKYNILGSRTEKPKSFKERKPPSICQSLTSNNETLEVIKYFSTSNGNKN